MKHFSYFLTLTFIALLAFPSMSLATISWAEINGDFIIIDGTPSTTKNPVVTKRLLRSKQSTKQVKWNTSSSRAIYRISNYPAVAEAAMIHDTGMYNLSHIGLPQARLKYGTGAGITVAVVDTGVAPLPSFGDRLLPGYNSRAQTSMIGDLHGHGTQVASIIGASLNNFHNYVGVAPEVNILPVGVMSSKGEGSDADVARGIVYAAQNGAHIINLSLGGEKYSKVIHDAMVWAKKQGSILVCAAGNSSLAILDYPASDPTCIPVRASDEARKLATYSSYGYSLNKRARGLTAPGFSWAATREDAVEMFYGTSAAAPHVAGTLALLLSRGEREQELYRYTNDMGARGLDPIYGRGLLNLNRLNEPTVCPKTFTLWVPHSRSVSTNRLPRCYRQHENLLNKALRNGEIYIGRYHHYKGKAKTLNGQISIQLPSKRNLNHKQSVVIHIRTLPLQGNLKLGQRRCGIYAACKMPVNRIPFFSFSLGKKHAGLWSRNKPVSMRITRAKDGAYWNFTFKKWNQAIRSNALKKIQLDKETTYTIRFSQGGITTPYYAMQITNPVHVKR